MSRENVNRFVEATEAFNRGDAEAWLQHPDTEVVFEPQVAEMEGAYVGHDGLRAFITTIGDLFESFQVRLQDVRDLGERVLALGTATSIGRGSGIEQETSLAIVASFRDGRMTHFKDYGDEDQALEALGLREQAMSRDSVDTLRRGYEMFNEGNPEWFLSKLGSEFVYRARDELPGGGEFEGRGTFEDRIAALRDVFAEVHFEPEEFVEVGDLVVVALRQTARGRTSGAALEQSITHVWRIEEGTARELRVFSDHAEALAAVGLRP